MVAWRHFLCSLHIFTLRHSAASGNYFHCGNFAGSPHIHMYVQQKGAGKKGKKRWTEAVEVNDVATCFLLVVFPLDDDDDDGRPAVAAPPAT